MTLVFLAVLLQAKVSIGEIEIPVRVRAKNGERGPSANDFGEIKKGEGVLVAFARDRYIHFYAWTRTNPGRRLYDVAWIASSGEVTEVVPLINEEMPDPRPAYGINKVKGITSAKEVQYALFLPPNSKVKKGATAKIDPGGAEIQEMPALECDGKKIFVEIVATEPDRSRGLTYRPNLSKGEGMIFAFPDARKRPFWMYHTYLSIDVSYVKSDGELLEINPMKKMRNPDDEKAARNSMVPTKVEAHYVLETGYEFMKEAGYRPGDKFTLPKELTEVKPEKSPFEE
jgi:hypothetical protein